MSALAYGVPFSLNGFVVNPVNTDTYSIFRRVRKQTVYVATVKSMGTGDSKRFSIVGMSMQYTSLHRLTNDLKSLSIRPDADTDAINKVAVTANLSTADLKDSVAAKNARQRRSEERRAARMAAERAKLQAEVAAMNEGKTVLRSVA